MQTVKFNEDHYVSPDGVTSVLAKKGEVHELPDGVAASLIANGFADHTDSEPAPEPDPDGEGKDAGDADENKDAGDADENKDAEPTVTLEDLLQLTRKQLDATALAAGVESPGDLKTKTDVAEATLAAYAVKEAPAE